MPESKYHIRDFITPVPGRFLNRAQVSYDIAVKRKPKSRKIHIIGIFSIGIIIISKLD